MQLQENKTDIPLQTNTEETVHCKQIQKHTQTRLRADFEAVLSGIYFQYINSFYSNLILQHNKTNVTHLNYFQHRRLNWIKAHPSIYSTPSTIHPPSHYVKSHHNGSRRQSIPGILFPGEFSTSSGGIQVHL